MQLPYVVGQDVQQDPSARPARVATLQDPGVVGQAEEKAGQQGQQVADQMVQVAKIQAGQTLLQKRNDYDQSMTTFLYGDGTPQNPGLMSAKGADAAGAMQKYADFNQKAMDNAMTGITNPLYQNQLKNELTQASIEHQRSIGDMVTNQTRAYTGDLLSKRLDILAQQASITPEDDTKIQGLLKQSDAAMSQLARVQGAAPGDDISKAAIQNGRTAVYGAQLNAMLESKDAATRAMAYTKYQAIKPEMSAQGIQTMDQKFSAALPQIYAQKDIQDVNNQYGTTPLGAAKIAEMAATKPPMYQKEFKDMLDMRDANIHAAVLQNQQGLMDAADKAMQGGGNYSTFPVDLRSKIQAAGLDQNYQSYNPKAPSNPDAWTYLNNLPPQKLATTNLNTPGVRLNLSPQDYAAITKRQQSLSNPQALASENDLHTMVKHAATQMGIDLKEKYDTNNLDENGNPMITVDGNQDFINMMNLAHQGISSYTAKHNGQYPDTPEVQKIVDGAVMNKVRTGTTTWHAFSPNEFDTAPAYKFTVNDKNSKNNIPDADVAAIVQSLQKQGITPTNEAIINTYVQKNGSNQ